MSVVEAGRIIREAASRGTAACAFNVIGIEHAEGIVSGAESVGEAVILAISENCVRYHGGLEPIAAATLAIAAQARVPVGVHLDHSTSADLVRRAAEAGIGSVMYDASGLGYAANVAATRQVTSWCHDREVWIEAELGEVGGKDGVHAPGARTKPEEAAAYVAATGVDALAVAVGSSHAMLTRDATLDLELIKQLHAQVPVPLVLHGSSGVPDETLAAAVQAGLTKINVGTQLNKVFTAAVRTRLAADDRLVDPRKYGAAGRDAIAMEAARLMGLLS